MRRAPSTVTREGPGDRGLHRASRRLITNERTLWSGEGRAADLPWHGKRVAFFSSGREAFASLLDALHLSGSGVVLLPAFCPEGLVAPCRDRGTAIRFYAVDGQLDPDWDDLERHLELGDAKLAVLLHHFGGLRDAGRFVDLCHRRGVLVLEDLAQAHVLPESVLGSRGDIALHSLPKIVGVIDGAALVGEIPPLATAPVSRLDPRRMIALAMNCGRLVANTLSRRRWSHEFWRRFNRVAGPALNSYRVLMWYFSRPSPMSALSTRLLRRFPWRTAVLLRKAHERRYEAELDSTVFQRLGTDADDASARMGFPVLVENRDALVQALAAEGIYGIWFEAKWDYFPASPLHDAAHSTMKHHFLFPTAYALSAPEVDEVIAVANAWAAAQPTGAALTREPGDG